MIYLGVPWKVQSRASISSTASDYLSDDSNVNEQLLKELNRQFADRLFSQSFYKPFFDLIKNQVELYSFTIPIQTRLLRYNGENTAPSLFIYSMDGKHYHLFSFHFFLFLVAGIIVFFFCCCCCFNFSTLLFWNISLLAFENSLSI